MALRDKPVLTSISRQYDAMQEQLEEQVTQVRFQVGQWSVNPALNELARNGEVIKVEPRTMQLLVRLAQSPGQVVSSQQLLDTVWSGVIVAPASVYQAISQLRKVLGDVGAVPSYIVTVPRKGYRLIAPVRYGIAAVTQDVSSPPTQRPTPASPKRALNRRFAIIALLVLVLGGAATLFAVRDQQKLPISGPSESVPARHARTIVVLPIVAAVADAPSQMLAPILTDLLRTRLARLSGAIVVSDASTKHAMQRHPNAIATSLRAHYLIQGDVARAGEGMRLTISLLDAQNNTALWSSTFHQPISAIGQTSNEVVRRIADAMQIEPNFASPARDVSSESDLPTYQLYLRGRELMSTSRAVDARQASAISLA